MRDEKGRFVKGHPHNKGRVHSEEWTRKQVESRKGYKASDETKEKLRQIRTGWRPTPETLQRMWEGQAGEKGSNWKGGVWFYSERKDRDGSMYRDWRNSVFGRDDYVCQKTGQRSGILHSHHIFSFAAHVDLRFEPSNGITLSKSAHRDFHSKYGTVNNTLAQLEEFLGHPVLHDTTFIRNSTRPFSEIAEEVAMAIDFY